MVVYVEITWFILTELNQLNKSNNLMSLTKVMYQFSHFPRANVNESHSIISFVDGKWDNNKKQNKFSYE